MAKDVSSLRNLAVVGHGGAGKTILSEALLLEAGVVTRVPAGVLDHAQDEKEKGRSIDSALAQFSWKNNEITLIDAPGSQDFVHNVISAISAVETSLLVVSATDGVTINTKKAWQVSAQKGSARIIVVTKLDGENVSFDDTVKSIQEQFGDRCLPLVIPTGEGTALTGVENIFKSGHEDYKPGLIEAVVETNDEMLDKYLGEEEISDEDLYTQLKKAVWSGEIFPIVTVVPPKGTGIPELLEVISELAPSPQDVDPMVGTVPESDEQKSIEASASASFSAQIFKIFNDPFGRVSYFRVYSGAINASSSIYIANTGKTERIGHLLKFVGGDNKQVDKAIAGEIVGIAKVENIQIGDTLAEEKNSLVYPKTSYPTPMVSLAAQPSSRGDEQKIFSSLIKLSEEDPTFKIRRDEETSQLIISGMSTLHLEIILGRLKSRYKVECQTKPPKIPYREAITGKADVRTRHKKQTGGSGEFGEVAITVEPTERGGGFEFVNKIVGGAISAQFIASTEKGIKATMERGILAGYTVTDVRVTLYDGKTHPVDSSDSAFQKAGSKAFQEAFPKARPVLLEPIYNVSIHVPSQYMGDAMGDLNSRRGRIMGSDSEGDYQTINAQVPLRELLNYSTELKTFTGGEGTYSIEFSHYDVVPSHLQDKIIAESKQEEE